MNKFRLNRKTEYPLLVLFFAFTIFSSVAIKAETSDYVTNQNYDNPMFMQANVTAGAFIGTAIWLMQSLSLLIVSLATLYFFWGVVKYGLAKSTEEQKTARGVILNGIIILFVMISFWGLVVVISNTFGFGGGFLPAPNFGQNTTIDSLLTN